MNSSTETVCIFCGEPETDFECIEHIHGIEGDAHEDCYRDFALSENKTLTRFMQNHRIETL